MNELRESLQQQTATADVLKVISRSTFDLQTVLNTLVESAARLCEADSAAFHRLKGSATEHAASYGFTPGQHEHFKALKFERGRGTVAGRALLERKVVHIHNVRNDPEYTLTAAADMLGAGTLLGVPLLREGVPIGVFVLVRRTVRPFTEKQIELATTFADQAVIAIENTRLLNELRQRTADLTESLEQQTATSEVLQVISSSPGDLEPVFEAMLENAVRICDATFGNIYRWDGNALHLASSYKTPPAYVEYRRRSPTRLDQMPSSMRQMIETRLPVQTDALVASSDYEYGNPIARAAVELGGIRTILNVPMVKENELVGAITLARSEVRPFNDKQIALVTNFARQAAVAIESARLLSEVRESLQQQTATADVLKVISRSTFDLQSVLNTLTESVARLCEADMATIIRQKDTAYYWATRYGFSPELNEYLRSVPFEPGHGSIAGRSC